MDKPIQLPIGMAVGDTYAHLVVVDDHGTFVPRDRITTRSASIRTWFGPPTKSGGALEIGRQSPWISRFLTEQG